MCAWENPKLPQLGARLAKCAAFVRQGARVADIGTDHGYLAIHLLHSGTSPYVVASDVNALPLETARQNARRLRVEQNIRFVQADGLSGVEPEEAQDIVIAGMGGELILKIVSEAPWLRTPDRQLILQPMTAADKLRRGLWALGFTIEREAVVCDEGRVYTVLSASYTGEHTGEIPPLLALMGKIEPHSPYSARYATGVLKNEENRMCGMRSRGEDTAVPRAVCAAIRAAYLEENHDN